MTSIKPDLITHAIKVKQVDSTIVLKNETAELKKLVHFFNDIAKALCCTSDMLYKVRMAIDEAMTNCIQYAYPGLKDKEVTLHAYTDNGQLCFVIKDEGIPFNPVTYQENTIDDILNMDIANIKIGGLGIPLMKKTFDKLEYQRLDNKNILTLITNLDITHHEH